MLRIKAWRQRTTEGSLSDLEVEPDPDLAQQICSEPHICTPKSCGTDGRCFYQNARKKLLTADIVVVNHTLFFVALESVGDLESRTAGYLFPHDFVVFDEAHTLESVAARQIGIGISQYGLRQGLHRLYNPKTQKGLFALLRQGDAVKETAEELDTVINFLDQVEGAVSFQKARECRADEPHFVPDTISIPLPAVQKGIIS